ncbi:MAG: primosomal protein N' [Prevotellaceae bacterium]|jgi:primosomal protein N' (replication factor Y)|nr:primosomal protein N' [Prevotellaceae bacterium]
MFVDVILPLALSELFSYSVPAEWANTIVPGIRVAVQVGQKKLYSAIVYRVYEDKPATGYVIKEIFSVLDETPIVNDYQLKLWEWISAYYMCSLGEVMKVALPAGLKMESETRVCIVPFDNIDVDLSDIEKQIIRELEDKERSIEELYNRTKRRNILPAVKLLLDKGLLSIREELKTSYRAKTATFVRLHPSIDSEEKLNEALEAVKRADKQRAIVEGYIHAASPLSYKVPVEMSRKELLKLSRSSSAALKACVDKNILEYLEKQIGRIDNSAVSVNEISNLSSIQQQAFDKIKHQFTLHNTVLLHGVTSSGKTEIYIKLISEQLQQGKHVLYLLPEIALTTQIIHRLKNVFGNRIGVYHSHFNNHERIEVYNNLLEANNDSGFVILGVRSSIFLPYTKLGLIIVDEEHENTYKQYDPAPRYHARDSVIVLSQLHGAKVLLGTATPAIETYYNAVNGKYGLVKLSERFGNMELPVVETVDMVRARKRKQVHTHFSGMLLDGIQDALEQGEQVILFQNRRGFSPFVMCQTCGYTPRCEYCDVSLTYHKYNSQLVCHYCGYAISMQHHCPQCQSADIQACGFGTEKIEEELKLLIPEARIERLDLDNTRQKNAYERILHDFEEQEINILVGTQMVTKGLDFDNVSLVGVLNADNMLNFPDFRAHERSYQLMAQVGGRAGRKNKKGRVLIQTSDTGNPVIRYIQQHDYLSMYNSQIEERKVFNYPPFCRLLVLTLKHTNKNVVDEAAITLSHTLKAIFGNRLAGPETPLINRIQNKYLLNFRLKLGRDKAAQQAKVLLRECFDQLIQSKKEYRTLKISVDVDPM